jgi:sugar-specific transcriptional regulator TrmB
MINTLTQLGLNNNQAQARLAVWQYGLSPASHIAKIINKERTHAYKLLSQLHDDGLVEISMRGKTRYFYVPDKSVLQ